MADVQPFVGTHYAEMTEAALKNRLTPPYDVIDQRLQEDLYQRDPHNFVRVDLCKGEPSDNEENNRYTRAGTTWRKWKQKGLLIEDHKKSFYVYEQEFSLPSGDRVRRRGFFGAVRLESFAEGGIRAHEYTFSGPKADRFRLMRATNSQLSPIFVLFDDPDKKIDRLLREDLDESAPVETEFDGVIQRLWTISKPQAVEAIRQVLAPQTLFIADGHHRYETSLMYRDEMREAFDRHDGNQPYDYAMMYLNNIHDDGLVILPTHRVLCREALQDVNMEESIEELKAVFEMSPLHVEPERADQEAARLQNELEQAGRKTPSFVMILPQGRGYLMTLKTDVDQLIEDDVPRIIKELDVSILHRFIINQTLLGNPEAVLDDQDIQYIKDATQVLEAMQSTKNAIGFIMNPTKIEQVCQVAREGLRMPQKSTYFYPKLVTGLITRDLDSPW